MFKTTLFIFIFIIVNGCTQIITAPISVAGAVAGAAIDVGAAGVRAVTGSSDEDEE